MEFVGQREVRQRWGGCTHKKEQRLRELRAMSGGRSHDLIPIHVYLALTEDVIGIWIQKRLTAIGTYKRCGVAISRSPAFRNDCVSLCANATRP